MIVIKYVVDLFFLMFPLSDNLPVPVILDNARGLMPPGKTSSGFCPDYLKLNFLDSHWKDPTHLPLTAHPFFNK